MKQNITKEQRDELSNEMHSKVSQAFPCLDITIGKLIEFLGDDMLSWKSITGEWTVATRDSLKDFKAEELIDALWEAVRYKLKK